ncbi:glutamine--fructose-6-phosphate transaminase (isomerizing) [Amylibacter sp. SFDW26]|uniref:glutamine--fructose-6-phosphate transaminase (isomerizing) n=1 Tax=Amylibacter sp. SFDW26 TaxID=2652722 RepID=UPI001262020F|nr:glutamine--fructose-6-phosphate transaminase (isomerizing) [Amylibacter sp. SFDW26]KAB7616300.1 glutamine--fructose-6-phosphate transaminase (isomerizing) [Amylibacter sp. SFDW26]
MCGIVGILGQHEAAPILVDALRRLEYRGYDSAGIATVDEGKLGRRRAVGKLVNLADLLMHEPITGKSGIGHTRWATHGAPTVVNSHPHRARNVAVVHNGIIENFKELRDELTAGGIIFETETDTETVVQLCMTYLDQGMSPVDAADATIKRLEGAYALCFLFEGEDDLLIAARKGSPLAIGHGDNEMFVGSDALALAPMTDKVTYLEEGDWAVLTRTSLEIRNAKGKIANRDMRVIPVEANTADKGVYKHYMMKEIAEQPTVLADAIHKYTDPQSGQITVPDLDLDFSKIDKITMVACGTAYLACNVAKYWFEQVARLPAEIDVASEFRYREPPMSKNSLALFVSQSGETADTLAALRYCSGNVAKTIAVVNVAESSISRESDISLPIHAGVEIGVASTKAFTCQLVALAALVISAARERGELTAEAEVEIKKSLDALPGLINQTLQQKEKIDKVTNKLSKASDALFLGRGAMYPLALEGALKLKEISYIHAEGYASGELKHGPIALVDENMPVIVLAPKDALFDKTVSNMQEVMARNGKVLLVTDQDGADEASDGVWKTIVMPPVHDMLAPILYAVPAQLLAYYTAVRKGTDVDQPRNLAKSVTVE